MRLISRSVSMPRTKKLVSALALALAGISTAQAQEFTGVISFGDSLSDAGNYAPFIPGSGSFTTNPDDVWTQVLASAWGFTQTPYTAGGTNYAWGGAPTGSIASPVVASDPLNPFAIGPGDFIPGVQLAPGFPIPVRCVPTSLPCQSVGEQIWVHVNTTGIDENALYTYWAGANDIFNYLGAAQLGVITSAQAQSFTILSGMNAVGQIGYLQAAGASNIVVLNIPDIGKAPQFASSSASTSVSGLVVTYNETLNAGLAALGDGIIPINAFGLVNEVMADPATYGFNNVTSTACNIAVLPGNSSLFCTPATYVAANANETYLFADGVHPTGAAHAMLAQVVQATIQAPGQVAMAAEVPLALYETQSNLINRNIFTSNGQEHATGDAVVYGRIQYARNDFEAQVNTHGLDSNMASASIGADVRWTDNISVGGAISFGGTRGDGFRSSIDSKEVLATGYGVLHAGVGYVNLLVSAGSAALDIDRVIPIGTAEREENGDTSARHLAGEIGGGLSFGSDSFRHGPFLSIEWQQVHVRDYEEDSLDSTSMWFSDIERESTIGRIGYRAEGGSDGLRMWGRIAYAKQDETDPTSVTAGSNTMNGHFTMLGFTPSEDWVEAELGLGWALSDDTSVGVSYRARLNDDYQDYDALAIDFRKEFGVVAAAPVEAVVEAPAQTCADLDDDGDGVNNCDDKCPATPSGEAVGADGCPVPPAAEPEPEMEPKPYRN
jgi:outer membrane lipase/esterase